MGIGSLAPEGWKTPAEAAQEAMKKDPEKAREAAILAVAHERVVLAFRKLERNGGGCKSDGYRENMEFEEMKKMISLKHNGTAEEKAKAEAALKAFEEKYAPEIAKVEATFRKRGSYSINNTRRHPNGCYSGNITTYSPTMSEPQTACIKTATPQRAGGLKHALKEATVTPKTPRSQSNPKIAAVKNTGR